MSLEDAKTGGFSQTETCLRLSLVNGSRFVKRSVRAPVRSEKLRVEEEIQQKRVDELRGADVGPVPSG